MVCYDSIKERIRIVPNWPKKGISFKDIMPLFQSPQGLADVVEGFHSYCKNLNIDIVAGIEARGFLVAPILAWKLGTGLISIRKKGKLPARTLSRDYQLEYGTNSLEIHADALKKGQRVLLVDDLLATGGSAIAAAGLIEEAGGLVEAAGFIVNLSWLDGSERLAQKGISHFSLVEYSS